MADENEFMPLASEEEVEDLEQREERAKKMRTLTMTDGWKDLLYPYILGGKASAINAFKKEAADINAFIASRQALLTLEAIEAFVNNTIKLGDEAHARLHPDKRHTDG